MQISWGNLGTKSTMISAFWWHFTGRYFFSIQFVKAGNLRAELLGLIGKVLLGWQMSFLENWNIQARWIYPEVSSLEINYKLKEVFGILWNLWPDFSPIPWLRNFDKNKDNSHLICCNPREAKFFCTHVIVPSIKKSITSISHSGNQIHKDHNLNMIMRENGLHKIDFVSITQAIIVRENLFLEKIKMHKFLKNLQEYQIIWLKYKIYLPYTIYVHYTIHKLNIYLKNEKQY